MRGRVFSAFYVMRDIIFLIGMAGAGLADVVDIRLLIVFASSLLFVSAAFTLVAPGLGVSTWGAAAARLRGPPPRRASPRHRQGRHARRFRPARRAARRIRRLSPDQRAPSSGRRRSATSPSGTRIVEHGDAAYLGVLHPRWLDDGRHPDRRRLLMASRR